MNFKVRRGQSTFLENFFKALYANPTSKCLFFILIYLLVFIGQAQAANNEGARKIQAGVLQITPAFIAIILMKTTSPFSPSRKVKIATNKQKNYLTVQH